MGQYRAEVHWQRQEGEVFTDNKYSRGHEWKFDGGVSVPASSSPSVVRLPFSVEAAVDPEEALVASLASCHMLFFLFFAAKNGFVVEEYRDHAFGVMGKGEDGKIFMKKVTLVPRPRFAGDKQPSRAQIDEMHHQSHDQCYIANSVKTEVVIDMGDD